MYTIEKNAQIVIALLKKYNICHIVISPGGTNIPIAQGVQSDPFFKCYSVVDERSAMYFAIGLYLQLGVPIATSCTSAQATRNYVPGLTEAYYKHIPILAITTSKHPRYLMQEYMQAPIQTSLPVDAVKNSYSLPYISDNNDEVLCERLANEAILELTHNNMGPVQLNLVMLDSETRHFDNIKLPEVRMIKRYSLWENWNLDLLDKKILIVVGEHRIFNEQEKKSIENFVNNNNAVVLISHLSNYHGPYSILADLMLSSMSQSDFDENFSPDILITIGGQTGDYPIYGKLTYAKKALFEHWRVSEDGNVVDTYDKLTKIFQCPFFAFFDKVCSVRSCEHTFFKKWSNKKMSIHDDVDLPFSNLYLAQQLHNKIPVHSYVNLAILNSLRTWSYFDFDPTVVCNSNVSAFGIDGCMSVLLGQSVETDELCFLVIGDLSFFYDMNSLGIRQLKNNIRILLVNNNGGVEFKLAKDMDFDLDSYISAANHNGIARGWAENNGFQYLSAKDKNEFSKNEDIFLSPSDKSIVFEVFIQAQDEINANSLIIDANRNIGGKERVTSEVKKIVGKRMYNLLKDRLKR
jgi:2-succinyl-5-enolpyruvyl-6-hydroxy-3-cyclohexene-1-carboxylate synthase